MQLGDIGVIDRRGWEKVTTLEALGIKPIPRRVESDVSYSYASGDAVQISALAHAEAGQALAGAEAAAGMRMAFKRGGAFVVRAENCRHSQIDNMLEVDERLRSLGESGAGWRTRRWVLVSQITTAQPCIVVVAGSAGAEVVAARGSLQLTREESLDARILSVKRVPLMWRGKVRRKWPLSGLRDLGRDDLAAASPEGSSDPDELVDFLAAALDIPERAE